MLILRHTEQEILNIIITELKDYISFGGFLVLFLGLFIFGCSGSLMPHVGSSSCCEWGLLFVAASLVEHGL